MKTKTTLISLILIAAILVVAGCSSSSNTSTVATTAATTAATTSVSGGETTTTITADVTTTVQTAELKYSCTDLISEAKLTEILGETTTYSPYTEVCFFSSMAGSFLVFNAPQYDISHTSATTYGASQGVKNFRQTNQVGQASFDYEAAGNNVIFKDSSGKYTIMLISIGGSIDMAKLYQIAAVINTNTGKITVQ